MRNPKFKLISLGGLICIFLLLWGIAIEAQNNRRTSSAVGGANIADKESRTDIAEANELYYEGKYAEAAKAAAPSWRIP